MALGFLKKKDDEETEKKAKKAEASNDGAAPKKETKAEKATSNAKPDDKGDAAGSSGKKGYDAYFVSPHPDGGWQVKRTNSQKALKRFKTKAEAEAYAKEVAKNQGTNVVKQKMDGKIQKKH